MPDVYDIIALLLHANDGKLEYSATVQKLFYFYAQLSPDKKMPKYTHRFYGPFSPEVAIALDEMSEFSFIDEIVISRYYETYMYKLNKKGRKYANNARKDNPREYALISKIVNACRIYSNLQSAPLSYAAKSHHMLDSSKHAGKYTIQEIQQTAKDFDWDPSSQDAKTGIKLLEELELVA